MSSGLKATLCPCLLEPRAGLLQGLPPTRFCVPTTTLPGPSPFLCRTATVLCCRTERGLRGRRLRRLGSASHLPRLSDRDKPRAWWAAPGPAVFRTAPDPAPLTPHSHDRRLRSVGWEPALPWELGTRPGWGRLFLLLAGAGHRHRPECRRNPVCNPTRGSRCTLHGDSRWRGWGGARELWLWREPEDRRTSASLTGPGPVHQSHRQQVASSLLRPTDVSALIGPHLKPPFPSHTPCPDAPLGPALRHCSP